ncbi:MAG: nitroreductase [Lactobacillus helsingborgensis]|uniref:nitroreductase n=1 Tax=Lactobacillus TaxID=1578 RepID=UPI000D6F8D8B|nr:MULTISPECIES: nitroreductase [Lactobacillus]AWN33076.1 nitroreductase [Lactobacillus helsingborgensis]MBC6356470.1 nitroreductase [Lactobacillus helsingborgensis]MCT6812111.1 nitroreductase [Lactobacillus helsingborgensis]MCT6827641.1 nitroreductase [Lactobacillus helsingborgensis]MCT6846528.1 nitroreductase [Lactobacillus helsingborgensis]
MEFNNVYNHERVTRKFTSRKVNEKLLAKIIKKAQLSPSLLNSQPWKVYMITGDALDALKKEVKAQIDNNVEPHEDFVKMLSLDWDSYPSQNMAAVGASQPYFFNNKMELFSEANDNMFNAQDIAFLTIPRTSPVWSVYDLGIFSQSIMLLALDEGLSIMPAHSMVSYPELVRKYGKIPEDELVGMAIGLGYQDNAAEVNDPKFYPDRLPFEKIYKLVK